MTTKAKINFKQAVVTTVYVVHQHSPIIRVIHDSEGTWHFYGAETELSDGDMMIVSLEQMIDHDPTISDQFILKRCLIK